jgi:O-antigen ligase
MLNKILNSNKPILLLLFHVGLGAVSAFTIFPLVGWLLLIVFNSYYDLISNKNKDGIVHFFLAYFLGFELLGRMAGTSPYIPYESGKYFMTLFFLTYFFFCYNKESSKAGWLIVLLSLPSIAVMPMNSLASFKDNLVFNFLGIFNLGFAVIYFMNRVFDKAELVKLGKLIVFGIVSVIGFLLVKTPDFSTIEFTYSATDATAGGFGTNQVATTLGMGFFILGLFRVLKFQLFKFHWIEIGLLVFLFFRALLTFSRGGVFTGLLGLALPVLYYNFIYKKGWTRQNVQIIIGAILLIPTLIFANNLTNNKLFERYQGMSPGVRAGTQELTLDQYSTGRVEVFLGDLQLWSDHPIFGVGPGSSPSMRENSGVLAHVEISRLLAEHGIFGFFISLIFISLPIYLFFKRKDPYQSMLMLGFFSIAIATTFHSAMRTMIPPIFYGLGTIYFSYSNEYSLHRK